VVFNALAVRNVARFNPPAVAKPEGALFDWEIFNALGAACAKVSGAAFKPLPAPSVLLDMGLRAGPYGKTLSLETLKAAPHGVDLGPLEPSLTTRLETADRKIACAPEAFVADLARVEALLAPKAGAEQLRLVGRRHVRSNNSWMHNAHRLTKGPRRDHLWIHPGDARERGILDGEEVTLASRVGEIRVTAHVTERVMPGCVCLPHGFGQAREGVRLSLAAKLPGASYNDITDESAVDPLSGNAALNALAVSVTR
jgi:anaerobic selenocysteine-containing dehydrogenase